MADTPEEPRPAHELSDDELDAELERRRRRGTTFTIQTVVFPLRSSKLSARDTRHDFTKSSASGTAFTPI